MTENDLARLVAAHEARHGEMPEADIDRLMGELEAHVEKTVRALPVVEEGGKLVVRVPDLLPAMRRFVAERLGAF